MCQAPECFFDMQRSKASTPGAPAVNVSLLSQCRGREIGLRQPHLGRFGLVLGHFKQL